MSIYRFILLAAFLIAPGVASAEQVVAKDATSIANFFLGEGIEPTIEVDSVGDPKISVDFYGTDFVIYYYGCNDGADCDSIQLYSGYRTDGSVRLAAVNQWNADNRFGLAYVSDKGHARLELDVYLGNDGMSGDDFAKMISRWVRSVNEFETFIEW